MPIVRQKMQEFVKNGGNTINDKNHIYVKNTPAVVPQSQQKDKVKQALP